MNLMPPRLGGYGRMGGRMGDGWEFVSTSYLLHSVHPSRMDDYIFDGGCMGLRRMRTSA